MARMLANPATLTRNSPIFSRFFSSTSCRPVWGNVQPTRIPAKTLQITGFKACSSCSSYLHPLNFGYRAGFKNLSHSNTGFGQLGFDRFRVLAASGAGSEKPGGTGGYGDGNSGRGGGAGDGSAGDGGDGGAGGNNWSFLSWYMAMLAKFPVLTKAITSAILTLMGDVICQLVIEQVPSLDLKRTFVFTFLGLVLVGPTLHFWYLYLSKLVTMPGASGAFSRLVLDQFLFSPLFIGFFLSTLVTLEGRPSEVIPRLEQEWLSSVLANWKLWIPFQFLNFLFVPQQFQVLGANFIAIIWNVILSFKAHKEVLPK